MKKKAWEAHREDKIEDVAERIYARAGRRFPIEWDRDGNPAIDHAQVSEKEKLIIEEEVKA